MMNLHAELAPVRNDNQNPSLTLTVPQMAKELNISRNTAYELTKQKGFPCFHVEKRVLINRDMLQSWLDEQCSRTA
jgi:excisionase family DNA binding protein